MKHHARLAEYQDSVRSEVQKETSEAAKWVCKGHAEQPMKITEKVNCATSGEAVYARHSHSQVPSRRRINLRGASEMPVLSHAEGAHRLIYIRLRAPRFGASQVGVRRSQLWAYYQIVSDSRVSLRSLTIVIFFSSKY